MLASHTHVANEFQHGADILQLRHIAQHHLPVGQQGSAQFWQRGIFSARDINLAIQRMTATNDEFVHFLV